MGQNVISWRRVKQINRALDERFVHATTRHHYLWHCVRHDGSAAWVDVKTLEIEPDPNPENWNSCNLLRSRDTSPYPAEWLLVGGDVHVRIADNVEFLAELDRRQHEIEQSA